MSPKKMKVVEPDGTVDEVVVPDAPGDAAPMAQTQSPQSGACSVCGNPVTAGAACPVDGNVA